MFIIHVDLDRCSSCKGECCKIYVGASEGGTRNEDEWWEDWIQGFHCGDSLLDRFKNYSVHPLYDPFLVHLFGNRDDQEQQVILDTLHIQGLDERYCEYRNPKIGCIIPEEHRPIGCRMFQCDTWRMDTDEEYRERVHNTSKQNASVDEIPF